MYNLSKDEVFVLGNIGIMGVLLNKYELSYPMIEMLQTERPDNAAGFVAEALYLNSLGEFGEAASLLEVSGSLEADINRDEALALYIFSLFHSQQQERAYQLARALLAEETVETEDPIRALSEIIDLYEKEYT
ncbi:MAG: hypothetical protein V7776_23070 [Halopseudomonas aestusnigri]